MSSHCNIFVSDSYVARNSYMESNLATVAIKIRDENGLEEEAAKITGEVEMTGLGIGAPALNLIGASVTHTFDVVKAVGGGGGKAVEGIFESGASIMREFGKFGVGLWTTGGGLGVGEGGKKKTEFEAMGEDIDGESVSPCEIELQSTNEASDDEHEEDDVEKGNLVGVGKDSKVAPPPTAQARVEMRNLLRQNTNVTESGKELKLSDKDLSRAQQISNRSINTKRSSSAKDVGNTARKSSSEKSMA